MIKPQVFRFIEKTLALLVLIGGPVMMIIAIWFTDWRWFFIDVVSVGMSLLMLVAIERGGFSKAPDGAAK